MGAVGVHAQVGQLLLHLHVRVAHPRVAAARLGSRQRARGRGRAEPRRLVAAGAARRPLRRGGARRVERRVERVVVVAVAVAGVHGRVGRVDGEPEFLNKTKEKNIFFFFGGHSWQFFGFLFHFINKKIRDDLMATQKYSSEPHKFFLAKAGEHSW